MITESQMRQALETVLHDVAQAIMQALPQQAKEGPQKSYMTINSDIVLSEGRMLVTVADTAALLSVSRTNMYRLIMEKQIPSVRIGLSRRVPVRALQEFIDRELQATL